jgi:hypothetical protein
VGCNAVLADALAHRAGFRDEWNPEAEGLDRLQLAGVRSEPNAWDASGGAHLDAAPVAADRLPETADADVEKSVVPAQDVLASDARLPRKVRLAQSVQLDAVAELCIQAVDQSEERSSAEQAAAVARQQPEALRDVEQPAGRRHWKPRPEAPRASRQVERLRRLPAAPERPKDAAEQPRAALAAAEAEQAFQWAERPLPDAEAPVEQRKASGRLTARRALQPGAEQPVAAAPEVQLEAASARWPLPSSG